MAEILEDKLGELIRNCIKTFEESKEFNANHRMDFESFMLFEMEHRLRKLNYNNTIYDYKIEIESNKLIKLHYQRRRSLEIETIEVKDYMRETKIDNLLGDE